MRLLQVAIPYEQTLDLVAVMRQLDEARDEVAGDTQIMYDEVHVRQLVPAGESEPPYVVYLTDEFINDKQALELWEAGGVIDENLLEAKSFAEMLDAVKGAAL